MEKQSPKRNFENRMNLEISLESLRNENANEKLSIRKDKRIKNMILGIKEKKNFIHESHYSIHTNLLKTNSDGIRNFNIDLKNAEDSMQKLAYLLSSQDDNEVKFGLFAVRKFFENLMRVLYDNQGQNISYKLSKNEMKISSDFDIFLNNNIIDLLFKVLNKNIDKDNKNSYINIYEIVRIFINMSSIYPQEEKKRYEFFNILLNKDNLNILINTIKVHIPQEIISNVFLLFANVALEEDETIEILVNSPLISVIFFPIFDSEKVIV